MMLLLLLFSPVFSSPIDIFGFGVNSSQSNTGTAGVGMEALSLNPAGVQGKRSILMGYSLLRTDFVSVSSVAWDSNQDGTINEYDERLQTDVNYRPADGISFGIVQPMMKRVTFGLNAYFPSAQLLRLHTYDSALPSYFLYRSNLQRYGIIAGFSLEILKNLRLGVGVDLLYTARFSLVGTLKGVVSDEEESEEPKMEAYVDLHETSLEASPAGAYILGVQWEPSMIDGLRIGAAYRTEHSNAMNVELDLQADGSLSGIENFSDQNTTILAPVSLSLLDFYKPAELRLGIAWEKWDIAQIMGDIVWTGWKDAFLNTLQVSEGSLFIPILYDEPIPVLDGNPYELELQDVWSFRLGFASKWSLGKLQITWRGGVGHTTSALAKYGRNTTPLEAARMLFSSGASLYTTSPILQKPMSLSLIGQWQKLAKGYLDVAYDTPYTLGAPEDERVPFGGNLFHLTVQTQVHY